MASRATVEPIAPSKDSNIDFGATVANVDIENLTGKITITPCGSM
jgi:hypothetical protein